MNDRRQSQLEPTIEWVPLGKLTVFHVSEAELDALERGSTESLFLNLGIATLSIAISLLISLLSADIPSTKTFTVFVVVCTVCFIGGVMFVLLWWQSRKSLKKVAQEIRNRKPPEGIQEDGATEG